MPLVLERIVQELATRDPLRPIKIAVSGAIGLAREFADWFGPLRRRAVRTDPAASGNGSRGRRTDGRLWLMVALFLMVALPRRAAARRARDSSLILSNQSLQSVTAITLDKRGAAEK